MTTHQKDKTLLEDAAPAHRELRCRYLWVGHNSAKEDLKCQAHDHTFWHTDFAVSGTFRILGTDVEHRLRLGDAVIIPPHVTHYFDYEAGCSYMSIRFEAEGMPDIGGIRHVQATHRTRALAASMRAVAPPGKQPSPQARETLEYLIAAWLSHCFPVQKRPNSPDEPRLVQRIEEMVRKRCDRAIRVSELAWALSYSESHISAVFRRARGISLKHFIDQCRAERAGQLLRYADLTISQVADTLEFPDLFAFSRFFKRVTGHSPRDYRDGR